MAVTPQTLLPLLGSVWRTVFSDEGQLAAYLAGLSAVEAEVDTALTDAIAAVNRRTTPIYRTPRWQSLVLRQTKLNDGSLVAYRFGDADITYGSGISYGATRAVNGFRFSLPTGLVSVPFIATAPANPSLIWTEGIDYTINLDENYIEFAQNPFDVAAIPLRGLYASDNESATDYEIELWLHQPRFDEDNVYKQWGYAAQFRDTNGSNYRDAVNAIFDSAVEGASELRLRQFLSALCDVPIALSTETVESLFTSDGYQWIATDQHVYRHSSNAVATVLVDDTLTPGQTMTDALQIDSFGNGQLPYDLTGLSLDLSLLSHDTFGGLFFVNDNRPVTVTTDDAGYTDLRFEVGGWPADVDWLFDTMQQRGRDAGQTLAMLLDRRTNQTGQPVASNLPATINPAQFVAENVLRNNAVLVRIAVDRLGPAALSLSKLRLLRRLLPPHATVLIELTATALTSTLDASAITDTITPISYGDTQEDELDPVTLLPDVLTARYIDGICL